MHSQSHRILSESCPGSAGLPGLRRVCLPRRQASVVSVLTVASAAGARYIPSAVERSRDREGGNMRGGKEPPQRWLKNHEAEEVTENTTTCRLALVSWLWPVTGLFLAFGNLGQCQAEDLSSRVLSALSEPDVLRVRHGTLQSILAKTCKNSVLYSECDLSCHHLEVMDHGDVMSLLQRDDLIIRPHVQLVKIVTGVTGVRYIP